MSCFPQGWCSVNTERPNDCRDCCESRVEGAPTDGASPTAAPATQHDPVERPAHYTSHPSGVECLDVIEHYPFNVGAAMKYLWRAGLKGDAVEDLRKAKRMVQREIERLERLR